MTDLCATTVSYSAADRAYIDGHRFLYGELGEHIATAGILFRDRLMRPGFVLPVIRLAPVAPYGHCMGLSGNSSAIAIEGEIPGSAPPMIPHRTPANAAGIAQPWVSTFHAIASSLMASRSAASSRIPTTG